MNRSSKLALAVAAALIAALAWRALHGAAPEASAPPAFAQEALTARVPLTASAPAVGVPAPLPTKPDAVRIDDPACIVKMPSPPSEADAIEDADSKRAAPGVGAREQASRASLLARMHASTDPYANAVAVWVDLGDGEGQLAERARRLGALAASTRDPRVYGLALHTCWKKLGRECESLSARRWSELDPGNALPWLMMLDEAKSSGDVSGEQEAMFHVTQSQHMALREQAPLQPIIDAAPDDPDSLAAARALALDAMGIVATQTLPQSVMACRAATPADANTWQQCSAMIDLMEHRSDSLLVRALGATLDKRLTGNTGALALLKAQRERIDAVDLASSSSCADLHAKLALMRRLAVEGEAAVAVDLVR
ncbi:MAG: hypothetical protein ABIR54_22175 [Burkholderiaceae bacterium]